MIDPMEHFFNSVEVLPNECWQWTKSLICYGYGRYSYDGVRIGAHRFSYMVFVGEIPNDLQVDHLCRNRGCVNPEHLELVSGKENIMRSPIAPGAINARKTHCIRGHEFTPENTIWERNGTKRTCRVCKRKLSKRYYNVEYHRQWREKRKIGALIGRIEKRSVE